MLGPVSRRDVLRFAGIGAFALSHPAWLGCGEEVTREPEPLSFDPARPWWMQNNWAPVLEENEVFDLPVRGELPASLSGTYLRNGPNPKHGDRGHWFLGDGMLHAIRIRDGRAEWYRNRWVRTPVLDREQPANPAEVLTDTYSNVSLVQHGGRVLSLGEAGLPFEVSATDLSTVGPYDYAGKLATFMTAHPKVDPTSGELHFFGYGFGLPRLTYHCANAAGELLRSEAISMSRTSMMHDFAITQTKVLFLDLPVLFDLKLALAGESFPFRWTPENGARIGVMPRTGGDADVVWIEIEPCYIFHVWNAYDDAAGNVVLEACRFPQLWVQGSRQFDTAPQPYRYTLDVNRRSAVMEQFDDRIVDFPQIDRRKVGVDYQFQYGLMVRGDYRTLGPVTSALVKYDRHTNAAVVRDFGRAEPGEPLFVPLRSDAAEDAGFVLTLVYDRRAAKSNLQIFDARSLDRAPLATVQLPVRVPAGAHGIWIAD